MERQGLREAYGHFQAKVDSFMAAGYEFHFFEAGFPAGNLGNALQDSGQEIHTRQVSYWPLVQALNEEKPEAKPAFLFTTDRLNRFSGERPSVSSTIHWYGFTPADSNSQAITLAYPTPSDSILAKKIESAPGGSKITDEMIPEQWRKGSDYQISESNTGLMLSLNGKDPVIIDTIPLKVMIVSGRNSQDATYLKAALEAIAHYGKREIQITSASDTISVSGEWDWLFWLSEAQLPNLAVKNIFYYDRGKLAPVHSWIRSAEWVSVQEEPVGLYQSTISQESNVEGEPLWLDGYGNPVLVLERNAQQTRYRLFTRFDPSCNDLSWSRAFPGMMLQLIYEQQRNEKEQRADRRSIDSQQLQMNTQTRQLSLFRADVQGNDLKWEKISWVILLALLLLERIFSLKTQKARTHAK